ncbi:UNVERIFIED_CONTAM: hypothetical protein PYX00_000587 [Menopon gallinae]|uniref:Uncharacterized protein n=1 Tax=Menopon gallinae TaxID=328185 RepID=A0AAW2IAM0_9NEOP
MPCPDDKGQEKGAGQAQGSSPPEARGDGAEAVSEPRGSYRSWLPKNGSVSRQHGVWGKAPQQWQHQPEIEEAEDVFCSFFLETGTRGILKDEWLQQCIENLILSCRACRRNNAATGSHRIIHCRDKKATGEVLEDGGGGLCLAESLTSTDVHRRRGRLREEGLSTTAEFTTGRSTSASPAAPKRSRKSASARGRVRSRVSSPRGGEEGRYDSKEP